MNQEMNQVRWTAAGKRVVVTGLLMLVGSLCFARPLRAESLDELQQLFRSGEYARCAALAGEAIARGEYSENWRHVKIEAEIASGQYLQAAETLDIALRRYSSSIRLRWLAADLYQKLGDARRVRDMHTQIEALVRRSPQYYSDATSLVVLGNYFLVRGADPRKVLELFFDRAKKEAPNDPQAYLAAGQLALDKHDYDVAAREFQGALKIDPEDPEIHWGIARAYKPSDDKRSEAAIAEVLKRNPQHVGTLLMLVDQRIDAEQYEEALGLLEKVLEVNPECTDAWAYKAVIANLQAEPEQEGLYRRIALGWWPLNPAVDHLIGRKLSQHYRFAEGKQYQQRALSMDADYLPAKIQLSNDLLRLGDPLGWDLAREVSERDGYNVVAHNLMQLQKRLAEFRTLERPPLVVRMDAQEADIYGERVLDLLENAAATLCEKYEVQLPEQVIIEIFPQQADFAIRTFGLPGGEGFLGVCFGPVITANSPAALGANSTNWEAVLWHEFCHVVTLTKTQNKMPRWFSEGISVYEERQANVAWGERITPTYRQMILDGEVTPLSQLSSAFMRPKSGTHLQLAYYQASLAVEYLIDNHGLPTILRILEDLALGVPMNESLAQRVGNLDLLDAEFAAYVRKQAEQYGTGIDWEEPESRVLNDPLKLAEWFESHSNNFHVRRRYARRLLELKRWEDAKRVAQELKESCPEFVGQDNGYQLLAEAHRHLGETQQETAVLKELAQKDAEALEVYGRLIELARQAEDWQACQDAAAKALAVNPLRMHVQQARADAAEKLGNLPEAVAAHRAVLALEPVDKVEVRYRLARNLLALGERADARHHVLRALEDAPRFRAAHRLLLEIVAPSPTEAAPAVTADDANNDPAEPTDVQPADVPQP